MKRILFLFGLLPFLSCFAQEKPLSCGTTDDLPISIEKQMKVLMQQLEKRDERTTAESLSICRIAVEIDSDTYIEYQRDTSVIYQKVLENMELSSRIFEREINTRLVVTSVRIWKDPDSDPFHASNRLSVLINSLSSTPPIDQNYDKRVYLYTKNSGDYAGLAHLSGIYSVSPLHYISIILHEFGHNFGSPHTHSCAWPGGPIDYCVNIEDGDCYSGSLESIRNGTIMSYCANGSGVTGTFHPLCQALMRNQTTGLSKVAKIPENIQFNKIESIDTRGFLIWPVSNLATSYEISYASQSDFSDETVLKSAFNGVQIPELSSGMDYYFRIRAGNSFGSSAWTAGQKIRITLKNFGSPQILKPTQEQAIVERNTPILLSYSKVSGATGYEIQVTYCIDTRFQNASVQTTTDAEINFTPPYAGCFRWRVRAVKSEQRGGWSEDNSFVVNAARYYGVNFPTSGNGTVPTSFPFYYSPRGSFSYVQITIADNTGFDKPLFKKQYEGANEHLTDFIKDLPSAKQLYMRLEEWNDDSIYFPRRQLVDAVIPIRTSSITLPGNFRFLSEIDQKTFGAWSLNPALTENYIWWLKPYTGLVKVDQDNLSFNVYNVANTEGLVSYTIPSGLKVDRNNKLKLVNSGIGQSSRYLTLNTEDVTGSYELTKILAPSVGANFNPDSDLFWGQTELFRLSGSGFSLLGRLPEKKYIIDVKVLDTNIWVLTGNSENSTNEIVVLNLQDGRVIKSLNFENTPEIKKSISQLEVSRKGNVWIRQYDSTTGRNLISTFDGVAWLTFDSSNSPFQNGTPSIFVSSSDITYAINNGSDETSVSKYVDGKWQQVGESIPLAYFATELFVDKSENIWLSGAYGVSRLANCPPRPVIAISKKAVSSGEEFEIRADNCPNGSIWSWKSQDEDVKDFTVSFKTSLKIAPLSSTQFSVRCAGSICADNDTSFVLKMQPTISLVATDKKAYCLNESVAVSISLKGTMEADNKFTAKLYHQDGGIFSYSNLTSLDNKIQFVLNEVLPPGNFFVKVLSSNPEIISHDSLRITVYARPSAMISADKLEMIFLSPDSVNVSVAFTGSKPWSFTRWDGQSVSTTSENYSASYFVLQPQNYTVSIKDLKDANCNNGKVLNTITIVASPVTSVSSFVETVQLYPNPTSDKIVISCGSGLNCNRSFKLIDSQGVVRQIFTTQSGYNIWDISRLPPGIFIVSTVDNGRKQSWKIVKE